jgi:hypothetical protein
MKPTTKIPKLSSLIKQAKFDWVNNSITDILFKTPKEISTDFKLYHFNRYISSEDAIKEMEKDGYKAVNAWELIKYAIEGWNRNDLVIGLGSVAEVDGARYVPYLDRGGSERSLYLDYWDDDWDSYCRFLGVRNFKSGNSEKALGDSDTLTLENAIKIVKEAGYVIYKKIKS